MTNISENENLVLIQIGNIAAVIFNFVDIFRENLTVFQKLFVQVRNRGLHFF